jgi:hypothetical protein
MISKPLKNKQIFQPKQPNSQPKKPPLLKDKEAMKKIVAKHEDIMKFFEKIKMKNKIVYFKKYARESK